MIANVKCCLFFALTTLAVVFSPMTALTKSSPVRAYFDIFAIEATQSLDLRLTGGLKRLAQNVSTLASTKPVVRFTGDLKKLEPELKLRFPNYRSFKLIFKKDVHFVGEAFNDFIIAKDPELKLRLYYLGKSSESGLHDVMLKLDDQFLCEMGIAPKSTAFKAEIPYGNDSLILAITLLLVQNPDLPYPMPDE